MLDRLVSGEPWSPEQARIPHRRLNEPDKIEATFRMGLEVFEKKLGKGVARPERLELPTLWFEVKFRFVISLICLGSACLMYPSFRWLSGLIGPTLDPFNELALGGEVATAKAHETTPKQ